MKKNIVLILLILALSSQSFALEEEAEELVYSYFSSLYGAYSLNQVLDLSPLFDLSSAISANFVDSFKFLIERRAYIDRMGYAYVEKRVFPLAIEIEEVYEEGDYGRVVFFLKADDSLAYPPFVYPGRNIFHLSRDREGWKIFDRRHASIDFHNEDEELFEPRYSYEKRVELLQASIDREFSGSRVLRDDFIFPAFGLKKDPLLYLVRHDDYIFDPGRALSYVEDYIYDRNPFYMDLQENCANFASQMLYYGFFGEDYPYIGAWNSYDGDFTESWIYVGLLMDYMTRPRFREEAGPRCQVPSSIYELRLGGVLEIKARASETYAHTMELVDYQKMIFSGNNYDGYRYYSDLSGFKRFYNPLFFRL